MDIGSLPLRNLSTSPTIFGSTFAEVWQLRRSVPIYLAVLVFPFLNFKSPTVFTKFTALGTVSVLYLIEFKWHFPAFTGLLTMSFFIHNSILTILGCQRHPENNTRDLSIGYALVGMSYIAISVTFYIAFPFPRSCILDNLLNNFDDSYLPSSVARVLIFFQMFSIFPLIMYLIRSQISCLLYNNPWPG
uniref:Aa_trans domain-containing protein n=1 Tax=Angiostrongylus cantonensis TaxID=6313 RepID=A0A0K0D2P0_ANGCA